MNSGSGAQQGTKMVAAAASNSSNASVIEYIETPFMRQRTRNFSHEETLALLEVWGDSSIQKKFESSYRHSCLWNTISQRMAHKGYNRTPVECKTKVGNLKCQYSKYRKAVQSGANPPEWPYLARFHQILTSRMTSQVSSHYSNDFRDFGNMLLPVNSDSEKSMDASGPTTGRSFDNGGSEGAVSCSSRTANSSLTSHNDRNKKSSGTSSLSITSATLYNSFPEALVSIKEELVSSGDDSSEPGALTIDLTPEPGVQDDEPAEHQLPENNETPSGTANVLPKLPEMTSTSPPPKPKRKLRSPETVIMRKLLKLGEEALELYKKRIENETAMFTAVANFFNTMTTIFSSSYPSTRAAPSGDQSPNAFPFSFPSFNSARSSSSFQQQKDENEVPRATSRDNSRQKSNESQSDADDYDDV